MRKTLPVATLALALILASSASAQTPPYTRTVIINSTGNPTADGTALYNVLPSLTPTPSSTNRWVIQLEGGVYDIGNRGFSLWSWVSLVGSGVETTKVRGTYGGYPINKGLVQVASDTGIRDLTIECLSTLSLDSCRAVAINNATNVLLADIRVETRGPGAGNHWGIRADNSRPVLDNVEVIVDAPGRDNYGVVYHDVSKVDIRRSNIVVQGAGLNNWGIFVQDDPLDSSIRDSTIYVAGGDGIAGGVLFPGLLHSAPKFEFENVTIKAEAGSNIAVGIGVTSAAGGLNHPQIFFRHGSVYGTTYGIDLGNANIDVVNSEVYGLVIRIHGFEVHVGGSWLRGGGTISALTNLVCAGNFNDAYNFYTSTCPP